MNFSFYSEKCFPLLSPVCFVLKLRPWKKSFYEDSNQMAQCKTFNGTKSCEITRKHLL